MKIALLTNRTTEVNLPVLRELAGNDQVELCHVFFFDTLAAASRSLKATIQQYGVTKLLGKAGRLFFERLKGSALSALGQPVPTKNCFEFARQHKIDYSVIHTINSKSAIDLLAELGVDVLLVCVCRNIVKQCVLDIDGLKVLNVHPSLLPNYRGPTPTFWMLYHQEKRTGGTIHLVTPGIDDGPILDQFSIGLDPSLSEREIEDKVFSGVASRIVGVLRDFRAGTLTPEPQNEDMSSYFTYPTPQERAQLKAMLKA